MQSVERLTKKQKAELAAALEEKDRRKRQRAVFDAYESLYEWQRRFIGATADNTACMLLAANQVGKSRTGCIIDAIHLLGDYPDEWEGHRFYKPPTCWLLGYSGVKTRDLLQSKLFGRVHNGKLTGGLVPADRIIDYKAMTGTSGACHEVRVQHRNGISTCQFWSYSQGQHALMGDVVDWYHIDEEPEDQEIYPQVLTRTINGDRGRGGRGILTMTPENGKTQLVTRFMDEIQEGQYLQTATWDDAPHIDERTKKEILSQYPDYQRDMRSRGVPLMGSGLIFEHPEESIKCQRFPVPDHFFLINGMDYGWDHPQAHIQLAIDPESAIIYVTHGYKASKKQPYESWQAVKHWAKDVPTAWPHDGLQHEKGSAKQQKDYYEEAGWTMLDDHAQWPDGGVGVEAGLMELNYLMSVGKFKVFDDLYEVLEEIREYHRKETAEGVAKIVKVKDDLICAIRYAYMMARYAEQKWEINHAFSEEDEDYPSHSSVMGY